MTTRGQSESDGRAHLIYDIDSLARIQGEGSGEPWVAVITYDFFSVWTALGAMTSITHPLLGPLDIMDQNWDPHDQNRDQKHPGQPRTTSNCSQILALGLNPMCDCLLTPPHRGYPGRALRSDLLPAEEYFTRVFKKGNQGFQ